MAAVRLTPMDRLAGLPLPIVPAENPVAADWHHHFHPKKSPLLKGDLGAQAVRAVRLQRTDGNDHDEYHRIYAGPPLPETDEERFATIIMAVAGYVPEHGISVRNRKPKVVKMKEEQRRHLQTSGDIKVGCQDLIRGFLRQYVMSQPIEGISLSDLAIEEFITTENQDRRLLIGHNILAQITDLATESVDETYWRANRQNLLLPGLPPNVRRFAKISLGNLRHRTVLVNQLHARLAV